LVITVGIAFLVGFILEGDKPFEYRLPGLENEYAKSTCERVSLWDYEEKYRKNSESKLLIDKPVLDAWKERQPAGGASSSALFTAASLFQLEQEVPGFDRSVRIISGASGGMVGAAVYVAYLHQVRIWEDEVAAGTLSQLDLDKRRTELRDKLLKALQGDFLSPVIQRWMFHDLLAYLLKPHSTRDRGWILEQAWRANFENEEGAPKVLEQPLTNFRKYEEQGRLPSLIFSPMFVEDGRRLLISNLDLEYMVENRLYHSPDNPSPKPGGSLWGLNDRLSVTAVEFYKLFPKADGFRVSTAARLSASFPYVSPAAVLPTYPPRRVVDAGYYDNYGVSVAADWLSHNQDWIKENTGGVVLIQLRAYPNAGMRRKWTLDAEDRDPNAPLQSTLQSYTAPLQGALAARRSTMLFRNDQMVQNLDELFNRGQLIDEQRTEPTFFFETGWHECRTETSLNWTLMKKEREVILASAGRIRELGPLSRYWRLKKESPEAAQKAIVDPNSLEAQLDRFNTKWQFIPPAELFQQLPLIGATPGDRRDWGATLDLLNKLQPPQVPKAAGK
jgi:hypothetical protein